MAVQADDKIVLVGWANGPTDSAFAVLRYTPDGQLDAGFGDGGKAWVGQGILTQAASVAIQPDGRIVVAGMTQTGDFGVARLDSEGILDPSFGSGGIVTTRFTNGVDQAFGVAVQTDGKIVVAGCAQCFSTNESRDFALARYAQDGSVDAGFGSMGLVRTDFASGQDDAGAVMLQPDGKIVAAGESAPPGGRFHIALARYDESGLLDQTFGSSGQVLTEVAESAAANVVLLQPNRRIVAVGTAQIGSYVRFALVRYRSNGMLDGTFGPRGHPGRVITAFGEENDFVGGAVLQPDGRIVVSGWGRAVDGRGSDALLARYQLDGRPDPTFGAEGRSRIFMQNGTDFAVGVQSGGKLVIGGSVLDFHIQQDFAAARIQA
jgi:uncharacterized delta-60 repeat protein